MALLSIFGPIDTGEGPAWAAVPLPPAVPTTFAMGSSPEDAVRRVAARARTELQIDDRHADVAASLRLQAVALDGEQRRALALLAMGMANLGFLGKITDPELLGALAIALRDFARKEPWLHFDSEYGAPATVSGALGREREICVLGSAGQQLGLVVYGARGAAELLRGQNPGDDLADFVSTTDALVIYLETEPSWARDVLQDGLDLPYVPLVRKLEQGRPLPLRSDEARVAIASLRAVVAALEAGGPATGSCEYRGKRVEVAVDPGEALLATPLQPARRSPLHDLDAQVVGKLLAFAEALPAFSDARLRHGDLAGAKGLATPFSLYALPLDGETIAQRAAQAGVLDEDEARWARAVAQAPLTLLEVLATSAAGQVATVDLFTGAHRVIQDVGLAANAVVRTVVLARPVRFNEERGGEAEPGLAVDPREETVLVGTHEQPLGPKEARRIRDAFLAAEQAAGFAGQVDAEALADPDRALRLLALAMRPPAPPAQEGPGGLRTTDGDPVVEVRLQFQASGGGVEETIGGLPGMLRDAKGSYTWTRRGNAMHPGWWSTVLGSFDVQGSRITVTVQSLARAEAARALLEGAFGERLRAGEREEKRLEAPAGIGQQTLSVDAQPIPEGPWLRLLPELEELQRRRADLGPEPDAEQVAKAHLELCDWEWNLAKAGDPLEEMDPDRPPLDLRRLLGLSWEGRFIGPDVAFAALGGGIPLSLVLPTLVAPVEADLPLPAAEQYALAVALWNGSRGEEVDEEAVLNAALGQRREDPALREPAAWMLAQARRLFPHDRREVMEHRLVEEHEGARVVAMWSVAPEALGLAPGTRPPQGTVIEYEPYDRPDPAAWGLVPPAWRQELVASALRVHGHRFGADFHGFVERWVELEDAVAAGKPRKLVEGIGKLERLLHDRPRALSMFAAILELRPEIGIGQRASRALGGLIDDLLATVEATLAERGGRS